MSTSTDGTAAALEAARRQLVGVSSQLLDLQADTGRAVSQDALDEAIERLAARLLRVCDRLPATAAPHDAD
ncbi:hypothetical protein [Segeticoccus rhizosphaerae]|jgi:hypothetical protein|uniref:hypothetical protein n=1 Tax=Segeticoccus rhizosphaerae TaxID=1104777 RepID=UPI0010C101DB|nr:MULTISPECIES: hypothetical protein [Intrasporangiaceae]